MSTRYLASNLESPAIVDAGDLTTSIAFGTATIGTAGIYPDGIGVPVAFGTARVSAIVAESIVVPVSFQSDARMGVQPKPGFFLFLMR